MNEKKLKTILISLEIWSHLILLLSTSWQPGSISMFENFYSNLSLVKLVFNKPPERPRIHNVVFLQIFDHAAVLLPNCLQVRDQIFKILTGRQEEIILLDKLW